MTTIYKYRIKCTTDDKYEYMWAEDEPTTCPTNTAHTIDTVETTIVEENKPDLLFVKEETTPTGGSFRTKTIYINALGSTTTTHIFCWPYPISALSMEFITTSDHKDDEISMSTGEDTITGNITSNASTASAWTAQSYSVGDVVTYTAPIYGARIYTCIASATSTDLPASATTGTTNSTYWKHGLELNVSSTVVANAKNGYYMKLYDGTNTDDVGRIISVDEINSKIYVETNLTNSFLAATPTYVQQTAYTMKDFIIGHPWEQNIGESKIGGSYVPADIMVRIHYKNNTGTAKDFYGRVDYLE